MMNKPHKVPKRVNTVLLMITGFVVAIGILIIFYSAEIFQKGDPLPYLYAATKINEESPYVRVNVEAEEPIYISRRGECQELLRYITESSGLEFQE